MEPDKYLEKTIKIVKQFFKTQKEFRGSFTQTYDDQDMVDFIITFKVTKFDIHRIKGDDYCRYEGNFYVDIDEVLIGIEETDSWETTEMYDLPSYVEDDLIQDISHELYQIIPFVCMDGIVNKED